MIVRSITSGCTTRISFPDRFDVIVTCLSSHLSGDLRWHKCAFDMACLCSIITNNDLMCTLCFHSHMSHCRYLRCMSNANDWRASCHGSWLATSLLIICATLSICRVLSSTSYEVFGSMDLKLVEARECEPILSLSWCKCVCESVTWSDPRLIHTKTVVVGQLGLLILICCGSLSADFSWYSKALPMPIPMREVPIF